MKKCLFVFILIAFLVVPIEPIFAYTAGLKSYYNCGNVTDIPEKIIVLTNYIVSVIQVAVPVLLVILGSIDLVKGITAGKEDETKKGQRIFIKRLITGGLVFFIIIFTKLLVSIIDNASSDSISQCIDCFLVDKNKCTLNSTVKK